jgi:hypothetical protein
MKQAQVEIGQRYLAKVSGRLVTVRVVGRSPYKRGSFELFDAVNLATGRRLLITAARLRGRAEDLCK